MTTEVKEIIVDLMTCLWTRESEYFETAGDRNAFEAELRKMYETLETQIGFLDAKLIEDYEEEIEALEEENGELASRNEDLAEENCNLRQILQNVSEAVNATWC